MVVRTQNSAAAPVHCVVIRGQCVKREYPNQKLITPCPLPPIVVQSETDTIVKLKARTSFFMSPTSW